MADENQNKDDLMSNLRFKVMPDLEGIGRMPPPPPPQAPPAAAAPPPPPPSRAQSPPAPAAPRLTDEIKERREGDEGGITKFLRFNSKAYLIAGAALLVLAAGLAAFGFYKSRKSETVAQEPPPQVTEPSPAVPVEEDKDADNDGLSDKEERELGTDSADPDSDADGLSDGDEVLYFETSPFTSQSDDDKFNDGKELKDGYSPLLGGDAKLDAAGIGEITKLFDTDKLHEPTISTLISGDFWKMRVDQESEKSSQAESQELTGEKFTYTDPLYGYRVALPGKWKKSGEKTNIYFTEEGSASARYVQVQAYVGVNSEGEVTSAGLLESEVKRLANIASSGVEVLKTKVSGREAYELQLESKRASSTPGGAGLLTSTIEYIVTQGEASFIITASCTSDTGVSCMSGLASLASVIEANFKF